MMRLHNWLRVGLILLTALMLVFAPACSGSDPAETDGDEVQDGDAGCEPGEAVCFGDMIQTCGPDGTWGAPAVCLDPAKICRDGECVENESRCPAGMEFNEEAGMCKPKKKVCSEGFKLNEETNMCVPLSEWERALQECSADGLELNVQKARYFDENEERWWTYTAYVGEEEAPTEILFLSNSKTQGGPSGPRTYAFQEREQSLTTCVVCVVLYTECTGATPATCARAYMPSGRGKPEVEFTRLDNGNDGTLSGVIRGVELREVEIGEDKSTTPVEDGDTRCLSSLTFKGKLPSAGFVDMEPPEGLSCDYPEGPYHFIGPEPDADKPWPGTVPPMAWPGAYINNEVVGFSLAELYCNRPEIKTVFIMTGAGWCPACRTFYRTMICPDGKLEDQLRELGAEILYVVGDTNTPGQPADNYFANEYMNGHGCKNGIRVSDTDNTAGKRVIWTTPMSTGIPWVSVIRTRDMKLMVEQGNEYYLDFIGIARRNLEEEEE